MSFVKQIISETNIYIVIVVVISELVCGYTGHSLL